MNGALTRVPGLLRGVWRERTGRRNLPRMLTYTVTFRCDARCVMCDSWQLPRQRELTVEELDPILAGLPRMDVVRLTGGEPTLRPDLAQIASLVVRHVDPAVLHLTTNGFQPARVVRFCEERPRGTPLHVLVSIDGIAGKHDEVRRRRGAFGRCLETLEALAPRRRELNLVLDVNMTVTDREAAGQYRALREHLAPLGVRNQLVVAYAESATYSVEKHGAELDLDQEGGYETFQPIPEEELRLLLDQAMEDLEELPFVERAAKRYYLRGIRSRLLGEGERRQPSCVALNSHLRIFPDGAVPVCQFNGRRIGNLREQSFEEVWFGAAGREGRDWVRRCPGCWAECEVLPSALYTGDALSALRR